MAVVEKHTFQAEIKQLLHILVHSLYKDREIFVRELISNASDALSKIQFEMLTNQDIVDPDAELLIEIHADPENRILKIVDTGIGMTAEEMVSNLGVIAHSGAREYLQRLKDATSAAELIGQFGVGFYSVFMVADKVVVTSRSYLPEAQAWSWISSGEDSYEIVPAEKTTRGTEVVIHLREDADEFARVWKLREVIKRHSDYVGFPIYLYPSDKKEEGEETPINQQVALWRRPASEVEAEEYNNFYRMLTADFEEPLVHIHAQGDAPIQFYALLYIPSRAERSLLSVRREPGLKLYTRKILIQEYNTDLLPDYLQFVQGVVDSEDLPLNISRETVQSNPQIAKLRQVLTKRVLSDLSKLADSEPEKYARLWAEFSQFFKHGVVSEYSDRERLLPLIRFHTSTHPDSWVSLDEYVERAKQVEGQKAIYYIITDSVNSAVHSPHLDPFKARGLEVLFLTETVDGFFVTALREHQGFKLVSVDAADLDLEGIGQVPAADETSTPVEQDALDQLLVKMRNVLGDSVESVRVSKVLSTGSPVRLVAPEGTLDRHTQRVYQLLDREFEIPPRILEINARHTIIRNLAEHLERQDDELVESTVKLLYENALLADGIHPNPSEMVEHIQKLMEAATRL